MGQTCSKLNSKSQSKQRYHYDQNDFDDLVQYFDKFLIEVYQQSHHSKRQSPKQIDWQDEDLIEVKQDDNQKNVHNSEPAPTVFFSRNLHARLDYASAQISERDHQPGSRSPIESDNQQQDQSQHNIQKEPNSSILRDYELEESQPQLQELPERVREQQEWLEKWVEQEQRNFQLENFYKVQQLQLFYDKFFEEKGYEQDNQGIDDERVHPQPNQSSLRNESKDRAQDLGKRDFDRDWDEPRDMDFICAGCQNTISEQILFLECGHAYHIRCIIGILIIQIDQEKREIITDSCQHKIRLTSLTCLLEQEPLLLEKLVRRQIDCLKLHIAQ